VHQLNKLSSVGKELKQQHSTEKTESQRDCVVR
jgi:hypothetical protein